eukprot:gene3661-4099_t
MLLYVTERMMRGQKVPRAPELSMKKLKKVIKHEKLRGEEVV